MIKLYFEYTIDKEGDGFAVTINGNDTLCVKATDKAKKGR